MLISYAADGFREVRNVITFREPSKLGLVIQPNVDDFCRARPFQPIKKVLGRRLGETDGEEFHNAFP